MIDAKQFRNIVSQSLRDTESTEQLISSWVKSPPKVLSFYEEKWQPSEIINEIFPPEYPGQSHLEIHTLPAKSINQAVQSSIAGKHEWETTEFQQRVSIFSKFLETISQESRSQILALQMFEQGKSIVEVELELTLGLEQVKELIKDINNSNADYHKDQTVTQVQQLKHSPLNGVILAATPFYSLTEILAQISQILLTGNTIIWLPHIHTAGLCQELLKTLLKVGLPPQTVQFLPGKQQDLFELIISYSSIAGVSVNTPDITYDKVLKQTAACVDIYSTPPVIDYNSSKKGYLFAGADCEEGSLCESLLFGAFLYQGQLGTSIQNAFIHEDLWQRLQPKLLSQLDSIQSKKQPFQLFNGPVLNSQRYQEIIKFLGTTYEISDLKLTAGGKWDDKAGYFLQPTILTTKNLGNIPQDRPSDAPILTVFLYNDNNLDDTLIQCIESAPTHSFGSIFSNDPYLTEKLTNSFMPHSEEIYVNQTPLLGNLTFDSHKWTTSKAFFENLAPGEFFHI